MRKGDGLRYNTGKIRTDLIPAFATKQIAHVFTEGAKKYAPRNWEKGMPWSEVLQSLERHTLRFKEGEDIDPETGLLHVAQIAANAMFLTEYYKIYPEGDNRVLPPMRYKRIGLDIDDVLADFCGAFTSKFNLPIPESWAFHRNFMSMYKEVCEDKEFWLNIKPLCNPSDMPFEPVAYVTSRDIPTEWTEEWLDKMGFPTVPVYTVGITVSKLEVIQSLNLDMFVDDKYDTFIELTNAGIYTRLYTANHNKRYNVGHRRLDSLSDIFSYKGELL